MNALLEQMFDSLDELPGCSTPRGCGVMFDRLEDLAATYSPVP